MRTKRFLKLLALGVCVLLIGIWFVNGRAQLARENALIGQPSSVVLRKFGEPRIRYSAAIFAETCRGLAEEGWINPGRYPQPSGDVWIYKASKIRASERHIFVYFDKRDRVKRIEHGPW